MAGALQYREYDFFTRLVMRMIARHHGQSTDTKQDIDYTDWQAVAGFAADAAAISPSRTHVGDVGAKV